MSQNLTFIDAYNLQLKLRESTSRVLTNLSQRISEDDISDELSKVALLLTVENTLAVLKQMKSRLKQIPASFSSLVGAWMDPDGLDILHHSIINNCPDMVEFLLMEPKWFPPTKFPPKNPYAHLAALFGFTECLRLILNYRPTDYFSGSKPSHVIRLPVNIRKRIKSPDSIKSNANKNLEKLLLKLKSSSDNAENAMKHLTNTKNDIHDIGYALTNEINALEKTNIMQRSASKRLRGVSLAIKPTKEVKRTSLSEGGPVSQTQPLPTVRFSMTDSQDSRKIVSVQNPEKKVEPKSKKSHDQRQRTCEKKHLITVHWDVFSATQKGVIQGAGEIVNVNYSESAHLERPAFEIIEQLQRPVKTDGLTLPQPRKLSHLHTENKQWSTNVRHRKRKMSTKLPKVLEPGIRGRKKYKDFHLNLETAAPEVKDEFGGLKNKTPLTIAAQHGYLECVQMILESFIMKRHPSMVVKEPLTLATKARSPDAIILLMDQKVTRTDYQSAVLIAIRDMYPDCLTALLTPTKNKERQSLFDGINLFHILYTQCLLSDNRYEMLPTMTTALINSKEDVNSHSAYSTFPLYTLINCAFNIIIGKRIFYYIECLKILLENKANPHFDEGKAPKVTSSANAFSRSTYSSAINCIFDSAANSVNYFESTYWSKILMKKFLTTLTVNDRTSRRLLNDVLFNYMNIVCSLGIDRYIVRCLLRYGANADFRYDGKYAINIYFDKMLPYLAKFDINNSYSKSQQELNALMLVCRGMSYTCLKEAELIFLNEHLLKCPIQALPLCRYFSYFINETLMSPRPLTELVAQYIWLKLKKNEKRVKTLPLADDMLALILP